MNPPNSFALYIHIPFCRSKCAYCDFFSVQTSENIKNEYIFALINEAKMRKAQFGAKKWFSIYIGGGTPSLLSANQIAFLLTELCKICPLEKNAEVTIECNPDDISENFLKTIKKTPINRLSLGIQSLNEKTLQFIGRRANLKENLRAIELVKQFWIFDNSCKLKISSMHRFSVDLICGLPFQTKKNILDDLQKIINCGADHISLYSLMLEENTKLFEMVESGKCEIDFEKSDEWWIFARDFLEKNGFAQYEVSNFCKKGFESKHNLCYWKMQNYIGIGSGATGTVNNLRYTNTQNIEKYVKFFAENGGKIEETERFEKFCPSLETEKNENCENINPKTKISKSFAGGDETCEIEKSESFCPELETEEIKNCENINSETKISKSFAGDGENCEIEKSESFRPLLETEEIENCCKILETEGFEKFCPELKIEKNENCENINSKTEISKSFAGDGETCEIEKSKSFRPLLENEDIENCCSILETEKSESFSAALQKQNIEQIELLDEKTQIFEFLMMGFRLIEGVNAKDFYIRFGKNIEDFVRDVLQKWQKNNLSVCEKNKYALNSNGLLLLNSFMNELMEKI